MMVFYAGVRFLLSLMFYLILLYVRRCQCCVAFCISLTQFNELFSLAYAFECIFCLRFTRDFDLTEKYVR